jgi:hypothetical protein
MAVIDKGSLMLSKLPVSLVVSHAVLAFVLLG